MKTEYSHIPILLNEVTQQLNPLPGSIVVDCTLGRAGHASALATHIAPNGTIVGIDTDDVALNEAPIVDRLVQQKLGSQNVEIILKKGNFRVLDKILSEAGIGYADSILFDIGVSSPQIDDPARGFSYRHNGPLDMRMDTTATLNASFVVNTYSHEDLTRIIREYGEEKWAHRIANRIIQAREQNPIETTSALVDIIDAAIPTGAKKGRGHCAKKTFQALRIEVNGELDAIEEGLRSAIKWLAPRGRVAVITFHSLEDRIVKKTFNQLAMTCTCPPQIPICVCEEKPVIKVITRKGISPGAEEIMRNPRAKSAKLRVAEKI